MPQTETAEQVKEASLPEEDMEGGVLQTSITGKTEIVDDLHTTKLTETDLHTTVDAVRDAFNEFCQQIDQSNPPELHQVEILIKDTLLKLRTQLREKNDGKYHPESIDIFEIYGNEWQLGQPHFSFPVNGTRSSGTRKVGIQVFQASDQLYGAQIHIRCQYPDYGKKYERVMLPFD